MIKLSMKVRAALIVLVGTIIPAVTVTVAEARFHSW